MMEDLQNKNLFKWKTEDINLDVQSKIYFKH